MTNGKETFKRRLNQLWETFQEKLYESHLFNLLKERYEALNGFQQKVIRYIAGVFLLIVVFIIPFLYFTSALSHWREFKVKYQLSLRLLKLRVNPPPFQSGGTPTAVKQTMERLIKKYQSENYFLKNKKGGNGKTPFKTEVLEITVKHLNIKQVVQLGADLSALPSVRLESLQMTENTEYANHYDTVYTAHYYWMKRPRKFRPPTPKKDRQKRKKTGKPDKSFR